MKTLSLGLILMSATLLGQNRPGTPTQIQAARDRKPAPAFSLADKSGRATQLSTFLGKVVVLNFWATECGGCRRELPYFVGFDQKYGAKGVAVVGISMDVSYENLKDASAGWDRVKPFLPAHNIRYTVLMGDGGIAKTYAINAMPATWLIDRYGRVAAKYQGVVIDRNEVEAKINLLLNER